MPNPNVMNVNDSISPKVVSLVNRLYAASDVGPVGHQHYVDLYTPDATLVMGPSTFNGHEAILGWRQKGWEAVSGRTHVCQGVFAGKNPNEVMMYGTVTYDMKDGTRKEGIEWSAHLLTDGEPEPKIKFYQVYITLK
ncbi:hypothetical protein CspeluHIS016_0206750 [Cutaneotrichosporon spelunceum]|uniref:SnoaL-like domain-containing protein n=1 Tax=Cutaneotrichosporon spelunceum TaxID=1672016 RepID=A0AAD3TRT9_9TREE|nr:hypothetical protein CspeluHIS016_0206750 [Cutaneotrichosporon spelunceum]